MSRALEGIEAELGGGGHIYDPRHGDLAQDQPRLHSELRAS